MALDKVCSHCRSSIASPARDAIPSGFMERAQKYLDASVLEDFRTFMSQTYHHGRRNYHGWCFAHLSKMQHASPTSDKVSHFAPHFVSLIGGALNAKNEQDARHFISVMEGIESLKTEVLKTMCSNTQSPNLEAPRYLLSHGKFSPTLKDRILVQLALKGAHAYLPLFEEATNPLFRLATRVHEI